MLLNDVYDISCLNILLEWYKFDITTNVLFICLYFTSFFTKLKNGTF